MRDRRLQSAKAIVERQQRMPSEGDDHGLVLDGEDSFGPVVAGYAMSSGTSQIPTKFNSPITTQNCFISPPISDGTFLVSSSRRGGSVRANSWAACGRASFRT